MNFLTIKVDDDLIRHDANNQHLANLYKLSPKPIKKIKRI
jgi:hypothetical protein